MSERPVYRYIPPNLSDTGGVFGGMFKMRNLIEAGVCIAIAVVISKIIGLFAPFIASASIGFVIGLLLALVAVVGVGGEPLSVFILNVITYKKTKGYFPIEMPMPLMEEEAEPDNNGTSKLDLILEGLIYGKKKNKD